MVTVPSAAHRAGCVRASPEALNRAIADITNPGFLGIIRRAENAVTAAGSTLVFSESPESDATEATAVARISPVVDGMVLHRARRRHP